MILLAIIITAITVICVSYICQFSIVLIKLMSDDYKTKKEFLYALIPIYPIIKHIIKKFKALY